MELRGTPDIWVKAVVMELRGTSRYLGESTSDEIERYTKYLGGWAKERQKCEERIVLAEI
jgi:hypothetical protein